MTRMIEELANEIVEFSSAHKLIIMTAESCSAGLLAHALSKGQVASHCLFGGVIAYTKDMKTRLLGVPSPLIAQQTAVSGEVAEAMALGASLLARASIGVAITGVAGPEPDEDGNPVGLLYCAVARADGRRKHIKIQSRARDPRTIIDEACLEALRLVRSFCSA